MQPQPLTTLLSLALGGAAALLAACASTRAPAPSAYRLSTDLASVVEPLPEACPVTASNSPSPIDPTPVEPVGPRVETSQGQPPPAPASSSSGAEKTLPVGIGLSISPEAFLFGAAMDLPVDQQLTAGPAAQLALGSDNTLFSLFGQLRYWLPSDPDSKFRPFLQGGVGAVLVDPDRGGSEWGPLLNVGAGLRFSTGESFRLGSSALLNFIPGGAGGEQFYFSWEILQVIFPF